jgi:SAM-dependent methyltransferase
MSKVKSYFDSHKHHHPYHKDPRIYNSIISHIKKNKPLHGRIKILDAGCGDGSFIESAMTSGIDASFFGTDVSVGMISTAKEKLRNSSVEFFVADGFQLPLKTGTMFELIHIDSVLHHLIGKTRSKSRRLADEMLELLAKRISGNGALIVEEMYYDSYIVRNITASIIFYGLKLLNYLHLNVNKILPEFQPSLEVNFLSDKEIENLLQDYGTVYLIKKAPSEVRKLYRLFLLKDLGRISFLVKISSSHEVSK